MKQLLLMIFLGALLTGCELRHMTELGISPEFSVEEQEMIIEAAEEWFQAVPEARVPVVVTDWPTRGFIRPGECEKSGFTKLSGVDSEPKITICISLESHGPEKFRWIVLHEIGHALSGAEIHLSEGNILSKTMSTSSDRITEEDADLIRQNLN